MTIRRLLSYLLAMAFLASVTAVSATTTEVYAADGPYFGVDPLIVTDGDEFAQWEFDVVATPGVEEYEIRLSQYERSYSVSRDDAGRLLVTGDHLADAGFDPGIEADLELIHHLSDGTEQVVELVEDLFPLPDPAVVENASELDTADTPGLPPLELLSDGSLELDAAGRIVQALAVADFSDGQCAVLQEGLPVLQPPVQMTGTWPRGKVGFEARGYVWVSKNARIHTAGLITGLPWRTSAPNRLPPAMQIFFSPSGHLEYQADETYGTSAIDKIVGPGSASLSHLIVDTPTGKYYPIGVGTNVSSRFSYALAFDIAPPFYSWMPYPYPEPCFRFSELGLATSSDEAELAWLNLGGELLDTAVVFAGLTVQFTPGYDCYDALVHGVTGWNAVGCLADLGAVGVVVDALRTSVNLQIVVRRGDDAVGAIKNIDGEAFADELVAAAAQVCSSFAAGTAVLLADGSTRRIEDVAAGESVAAFDPVEGVVASVVTSAWSHLDRVAAVSLSSGELVVTPDHPVWNESDDEWQRFDALSPGDALLSADGDEVVVRSISDEGHDFVTVYDLSVGELANFFVVVDGKSVLVHNAANASACDIASRLGGRAGSLVEKAPELAGPLTRHADEYGEAAAVDLAGALLRKPGIDDLTPTEVQTIADILDAGGDDAARWFRDKPLADALSLCSDASGGAYVIRQVVNGAEGPVVYVGSTIDFDRRLTEHRRDPRFAGPDPTSPLDVRMDRVSAADHDLYRGLEQQLFDETWGTDVTIQDAQSGGSLNRQRPIALDNPTLPVRRQYVAAFSKACG